MALSFLNTFGHKFNWHYTDCAISKLKVKKIWYQDFSWELSTHEDHDDEAENQPKKSSASCDTQIIIQMCRYDLSSWKVNFSWIEVGEESLKTFKTVIEVCAIWQK